MSVLVPAYRSSATLAECVQSILAQRLGTCGDDFDYELIVVLSADSEAELTAEQGALPVDSRLRVDTMVPRAPAAVARNRAAALARGATLVFTDADVVAPPGWLSSLVAAGRVAGPGTVVAGSVRNGTPASAVGTAEYLVQFSELAPELGSTVHGATCNLLVPRRAWADFGPFPEDLGGGEDTLLTVAASAQGRFRFEPPAAVIHRNRTALKVVLAHQREFGRFTARLASRCPELPHRRWLLSSWLVPVATTGRVLSVAARAARLRHVVRTGPRSAAVVVMALAAWGIGVVEGRREVRRGIAPELGY